jgi:hypothetical protein
MSERRTAKVGFDMGGQFVVSHESPKEETSMRYMIILKNDPRAEQQMPSHELSTGPDACPRSRERASKCGGYRKSLTSKV